MCMKQELQRAYFRRISSVTQGGDLKCWGPKKKKKSCWVLCRAQKPPHSTDSCQGIVWLLCCENSAVRLGNIGPEPNVLIAGDRETNPVFLFVVHCLSDSYFEHKWRKALFIQRLPAEASYVANRLSMNLLSKWSLKRDYNKIFYWVLMHSACLVTVLNKYLCQWKVWTVSTHSHSWSQEPFWRAV